MYLQPQYRVILVSVCFCQQCHAIPTVHNQFITRVYHGLKKTISLESVVPTGVPTSWGDISPPQILALPFSPFLQSHRTKGAVWEASYFIIVIVDAFKVS